MYAMISLELLQLLHSSKYFHSIPKYAPNNTKVRRNTNVVVVVVIVIIRFEYVVVVAMTWTDACICKERFREQATRKNPAVLLILSSFPVSWNERKETRQFRGRQSILDRNINKANCIFAFYSKV